MSLTVLGEIEKAAARVREEKRLGSSFFGLASDETGLLLKIETACASERMHRLRPLTAGVSVIMPCSPGMSVLNCAGAATGSRLSPIIWISSRDFKK